MGYFTGKVAVVTGAGSGIGQALAQALAERGAQLALCDIDENGLADTRALIRGTPAITRVVDISDRAAVAAFARETKGHFGKIHQLYNNAGIAPRSTVITDVDYAVFERAFAVNLWGVIHGTKEFLPYLIASGAGHVVNISSLNGLLAQGGMAPYVTSKFGVRGFTETLRVEMLERKHPVRVTLVLPGGVKTHISSASHQADASPAERHRQEVYETRLLRWLPSQAARTILNGVARGRGRICFAQTRWVDPLVRLFPSSYPRIVAYLEKRLFGASS